MSKVRLEERDERWELTLDAPPLHILDIELLEELREQLSRVRSDRALLLIRANGDRAFSAGASVPDHVEERVQRMLGAFHDCFRILDRLELVTVAAVRGFALGGGAELAMGCDLIVADRAARFGQPEIRLGVFAPVASIQLQRQVPSRIALELLLRGETIDAFRAAEIGLINAVLDDPFEEALESWLQPIVRQSASSLRFAKQAFRAARPDDFAERLALVERIYLQELMQTFDAHEGIAAFMDKRAPRWQHG